MSKADTTSPSGQWHLYVLECRDGALYTGISNDVARRYAAHLAGKGARYTRINPPQRIALIHPFADKSQALKAEYAFKRLSAAAKRQLVAGGDLSGWLTARAALTDTNQ